VTACYSDTPLTLLRSSEPDLVIAGLLRAGNNGIELCRNIKADPSTRHVPVLLVSPAPPGDSMIADAFDAGAEDYMEVDQPNELFARRVGRVLSISRDQLGRRLAKQALRESEEQYRLFFEANPAPMWVYDRDTLYIIAVNQAAIRHYGYTRGEFLEMKITGLRPAEDIGRLLDDLGRADNGFHARRPWRHRLKDGSIISVEISSNDLWFLGKRARLVLASDVTERQAAEEALRESEERFAKAFDSNPDPVSIHRLDDGTYIDVNQSFLSVTGFAREEVIGHTVDAVNMVVDHQARAIWKRIITESESIRKWETQFRIKSGEVRWGLLSAEAIDVRGVRCVLAVTEDITERRQLEEQLMQSQKMEAIGTLAGGIAHDFNNLLTAIIGHSQLLKRRVGEQHSVYPDVAEIEKAGLRAASLTRQLLAFSRKQMLEMQILDINSVIADMVPMLSRLIGEDITLKIDLDPQLGTVRADSSHIQQVIMNLTVNARDAMPRGGQLTIETSNVTPDAAYAKSHAEALSGDYVMLAVSDTGCGMDKRTQSRIFEPFFTTKEHGKGSGLGLSTTYGIVKQNGGSIMVYSEPGHGTVFKVYLPWALGTAEQPNQEDGRSVVSTGSETILLVEDEEMVRTLAAQVLSTVGYRVVDAANGQEAIGVAQSHEGAIDLLLTDAVMPEMSGIELVDRLHRIRPEMSVLMMSGYSREAMAGAVLSPSVSLLQKPFTPVDLCRKVREVLDG
jgi:two-component system, cell cycle sensor histidine kinase and response regulator CckA